MADRDWLHFLAAFILIKSSFGDYTSSRTGFSFMS